MAFSVYFSTMPSRATNRAVAMVMLKMSGMPSAFSPFSKTKAMAAGARGFQQQHQMRIGDEGRKTPVRLAEAGDGAGEDQPPVDPYRAEHRAPDRRRQILLDEILEPEEIVGRAGLPVLRLGIDGPGRDLVVGRDLGPADGGLELVKPAELAQFGPEHAVILRQPARIVALNIDDMAVLDAHVCPRMMADYNRLGRAPRTKSGDNSRPIGSAPLP